MCDDDGGGFEKWWGELGGGATTYVKCISKTNFIRFVVFGCGSILFPAAEVHMGKCSSLKWQFLRFRL
ncbi:hypothetical protein Hanom_Chr12g01073221 [Helianthus anomalus]